MRVCDASTSISAEFGGIRDSCLDIYHLVNSALNNSSNCLIFTKFSRRQNLCSHHPHTFALVSKVDIFYLIVL